MQSFKSFEAISKAGASAALAAALLVSMTGCAALTGTSAATSATSSGRGFALIGTVFGGQQPVAGSTIHLYAAGTSGYAGANADLLTAPATTNAAGFFSINADYNCTPGQQIYIVAVGGNAGSGTNANAAGMAALGDCSTLSSTSVVQINEVTTVGSVFALAPFMSGYANVGTSATNVAGLKRAFASVKKLVNTTTGLAPGPSLAPGATAPTAEINSLAAILAACINSAGTINGQTTACGTLFGLTTPPAGSPPTDTIGAALAIAKNPAQNVGPLYTTASPQSPFVPTLTQAPNDWTLAINYTTGGFNIPKSTSLDANGNVWVANSGNNTVSVLAQTGTPISGSPFSGNGLNLPIAVALDGGGNAWVANRGASSVSVFTSTGATFTGSPFLPVGLSGPSALAFDGSGNLWVANAGNSTVSELSGSGTALTQINTGINTPDAVAVNPY